jgi:nucleoid-associated protein YgaU
MQKDMKIGMFVGLVLAAGAMVYLCTRPGLSPRARLLKQNHLSLQSEQPPQPSADSLFPEPDSSRTEVLTPQSEQISEPVQVQPQPVNDSPAEVVHVEGSYKTQKFYIVRKGDTLSKISRIYYGSPNKWYKIYEANRDLLDNPDMLKPGMKLRIPN